MKNNVVVEGRNKFRHRWIWFFTCGSALVAIVLLGLSAYALEFAPYPLDDSHGSPLWHSIKDIGPAVAGFWVVAAAIFTITAAGFSALVDAKRDDSTAQRRKEDVRRVCIGEILAFWDRLNNPEKIREKIQAHIDWLRRVNSGKDKSNFNLFRRNFGEDWFVFSRSNPLSLSEIGDVSAKYISLSARARGLISRFNWMNGADKSGHDLDFWIQYHKDTLTVLDDVARRAQDMLRLLGEQHVIPATFEFGEAAADFGDNTTEDLHGFPESKNEQGDIDMPAQISSGRQAVISALKIMLFTLPLVVIFHMATVPKNPSVAVFPILVIDIVGAIFLGKYILAIIRYLQMDDSSYNLAFWLALLSFFLMVLPFNPWSIRIVCLDDRVDWVIAATVLLGTTWTSMGAILDRKDEKELDDFLKKSKQVRTADENKALRVMASSLSVASRYCRNGVVIIFLATAFQLLHLAIKARTVQEGTGLCKIALYPRRPG